MSLAVGIPIAISAIQALLKYRGRVDQILALKEASESLPFSLPPAPIDFLEHQDKLFEFFESEQGVLVLELHGRANEFEQFKADPTSTANFALRLEFLQLFYEASDTAPIFLGPQSEARSVRASSEMRLSYYVVASHRLSRNPALTRILLASADTLLEVAGANAGLFISNPKTQAIVSTLINEFAVKRDFDDDSAEMILKGLLRSAVVAAMENQESITEETALVALFAALSDMRDEFGDEFVAQIITQKGFQTLVGKYISEVSEDPSFLVEDGPFKEILSATLKDLGDNFEFIFDDQKALFGVLEVALTSAAGQANESLQEDINGKPLLSAVLQSVLSDIIKLGQQDQLFKSFVNGEIITGIFRASMGAIAADPKLLADAGKIDALSANLVTGLADVLSHKELTEVVSIQTLRDIASRSFLVLSENGSAWAGNNEFATKLLASVLKAASSAVEDGLSKDDITDLVDMAVRTATANLALVTVDVRLEGFLEAVGEQLSQQGVRVLLNPASRKEVILSSLEAVALNPKVWSKFAEADLVQPLIVAVFQGLATDSTDLLTGPSMVEGLRSVLIAAALRGQKFIDNDIDAEDLQKILTLGLSKANEEIGSAIDGETIPRYLERLLNYFLDDPFELNGISNQDFKHLHELAMERAKLVEAGEEG
jgi:hypothetical protein